MRRKPKDGKKFVAIVMTTATYYEVDIDDPIDAIIIARENGDRLPSIKKLGYRSEMGGAFIVPELPEGGLRG